MWSSKALLGALSLMLLLCPAVLQAQGKAEQKPVIRRVALMPSSPSPYRLRDWTKTSQDYIDLAFDFDRVGEHLPLIRWYGADREMFSQPSYVGQGGPEAINCMAAVVSGTLVGRDMTRYRSHNWVQMCQAYFSSADGVYTNNVGGRTGASFWYDLFPNVLFYQLADRYPTVAGTQQMQRVAGQWYRACVAMGGKTAPWTAPNFDHTAFRFDTLKPVDNGRWIEPDGAAGIAWLEVMAYGKSRDPRFLTAADWCLRALEQRPIERNPLYEVLLPYGALAAARMNAERGRHYDVPKLLNWCFEAGGPRAARQGWGVIADRFGQNDCYGLVGSVTDTNGYAFTMNTFEWAGALTPIARYDPRYAHDLGKWMLNLCNAARLFYPDSLSAERQDNRAWADKYDLAHCLAYEGLRKEALRSTLPPTLGPFATGDAMRNGGPSNLCLYGASHVGILGGIVGHTGDERILLLNLLKTDYFHAPAYPSYLLYNPYAERKTVRFSIGSATSDLYDAVTHRFVVRKAKDAATVTLSPDSAMVLVVVPSGGRAAATEGRMRVNGIVIDYAYTLPKENSVNNWSLQPFVKADASNPCLEPRAESTFMCPLHGLVKWEEAHVFNPAAVVRDGKVWLLYRAEDKAGVSRLGLAWSEDGLHFTRRPEPVLFPAEDRMRDFETGGCEDPRIVEDGGGTYLLTYTAYDGKTARMAIATSRDLVHWEKRGLAFDGALRDEWTKSGSIVCRQVGDRLVAERIHGKYWMYFRDSKLLLATSEDLLHWKAAPGADGSPLVVFGARPGKFDSELVEPGPPALLRSNGILLLYNGVNAKQGGEAMLPPGTFASGQILFDAKDPSRVLQRSDTWFLHPDRPYEITGQVGNVCFIEGLVPFKGAWFLYYGTADSRIGVAVCRTIL